MTTQQELEEMCEKAYRSNAFLRENKEYFLQASVFCLNKVVSASEQKCSSCQATLFRRFKNQIEIEKRKPQPIVEPAIIEEIIEENVSEVKSKPKKTKKKKDGIE